MGVTQLSRFNEFLALFSMGSGIETPRSSLVRTAPISPGTGPLPTLSRYNWLDRVTIPPSTSLPINGVPHRVGDSTTDQRIFTATELIASITRKQGRMSSGAPLVNDRVFAPFFGIERSVRLEYRNLRGAISAEELLYNNGPLHDKISDRSKVMEQSPSTLNTHSNERTMKRAPTERAGALTASIRRRPYEKLADGRLKYRRKTQSSPNR